MTFSEKDTYFCGLPLETLLRGQTELTYAKGTLWSLEKAFAVFFELLK